MIEVRRRLWKQEIVVRIKFLVRFAKRQPLEIRHPAVIRQSLGLLSEKKHDRIVRAQSVKRRLCNGGMRPPCETGTREKEQQRKKGPLERPEATRNARGNH